MTRRTLILLSLFLGACLPVLPARAEAAAGEADILKPAVRREGQADPGPTDLSGRVRTTIYVLLILGGAAALIIFWHKKGRGGMAGLARSGQIEICETRPIGHKQYLAVVRCGGRTLLLGVGPDRIDHLCFLDDGASVPAPDPVPADDVARTFGRLLQK